MLESDFQGGLIKKIKRLLPGAIVLKNDPNYIQGFPDLTILYETKWAVLEVKKSSKEPYQPNQKHYLKQCKKLSYSNTVYPENEKEVLNELQQALRPGR